MEDLESVLAVFTVAWRLTCFDITQTAGRGRSGGSGQSKEQGRDVDVRFKDVPSGRTDSSLSGLGPRPLSVPPERELLDLLFWPGFELPGVLPSGADHGGGRWGCQGKNTGFGQDSTLPCAPV